MEPARRCRAATARATRREKAAMPEMRRSLSSARLSSWRARRKVVKGARSAMPPRRVMTRAARPTRRVARTVPPVWERATRRHHQRGPRTWNSRCARRR